jgi:hypothetical protein
MKTITPSSFAFAQNGSNFGSESDAPLTWPPIVAPAQPELLDAVIELLGGQIRELQRHRAQRHEAILVIPHPSREPFVLRADDAAGEGAILHFPPPVAVDRQHLDVDPLAVDERNAVRAERASAGLSLERRPLDDLGDAVDGAVRVHVDDRYAFAADRDLLARARRCSGSAGASTASAAALRERGKLTSSHVRSRGRARDRLEEVPSILHMFLIHLWGEPLWLALRVRLEGSPARTPSTPAPRANHKGLRLRVSDVSSSMPT